MDDYVFPKPNHQVQDFNDVPTVPDDPDIRDDLGSIEVEEGAASVIAWYEGSDDNLLWPYTLDAPNSVRLYDFDTDVIDDAINDQYDFHFFPDSSLSVFLPNTPRLPFMPGTYVISIGSVIASDDIHVRFFVKPQRPEDQPDDRLNVNFWFVGLSGLNASNAASHVEFSRSVRVFTDCLGTGNIRLGEIAYHDLGGDDATGLSVITGIGEFRKLLRKSAAADNDWPNIFFIRSFDGDDLEGVIGLAGHIPGPPTVQGTAFSGVAVSMEYFEGFPRITGMVMAHELGHWLGLFHTSEYTGTFHDALNDTPQCTNGMDQNADGVVEWGECASAGAMNLMFWMTPYDDLFTVGAGGLSLSEDQRWVLERNPAIEYAADP
ncbi:MAG: hypothetical protein C4523_12420 [Myxococcales bacterium]|nr:MAG: hypothetical protein C4523_12420 [Myxococcales bacterium]